MDELGRVFESDAPQLQVHARGDVQHADRGVVLANRVGRISELLRRHYPVGNLLPKSSA